MGKVPTKNSLGTLPKNPIYPSIPPHLRKRDRNIMISEKRKNIILADFLNQTLPLTQQPPQTKLDASTILASLSNATETEQAEASLEALRNAVAGGGWGELTGILTNHVLLLDALALKLLQDAESCKSPNMTVVIINLALKTFDTARKSIVSVNDMNSVKAPLIALQVNT